MNIDVLKKSVLAPHPVGLAGTLEYFAVTELCSHVRLCRLDYDASDYSKEDAFAWCLIRGEVSRVAGWRNAIANLKLKKINRDEWLDFINKAAMAVSHSEYITINPELPITEAELLVIDHAWRVDDFNQYQYGPTNILLCESKNRFWYLEVHLES